MKLETKYGLLIAAGLSLWTLADFALGFHTKRFDLGETAEYISWIVPVTLLALLLLRRRRDTGALTLGQGVSSGLQASLVSGLVFYAFMLVYNNFINPGWQDAALDWKVGQWRAEGETEIAIRETIDFHHKIFSPLGCFLTIVVGSAVTGAIFSFLLALILRRSPARVSP